MNHYPHHIGDYAKDTMALTQGEHGAYRLLMDAAYATEGDIPADEVYAIAKAHCAAERKNVDRVLAKFFQLRETGWHQKRIEEEVAIYREKSQKAAQSAQVRWSERNANAMRTHEERMPNAPPNAMLTNNQEPITKDQEHLCAARTTRFSEFWEKYPGPRKVAKSKCAQLWGAKKLDPLADRILSHIALMAASEQWRESGGQFIPAPLTYLNQRRWEDGAPSAEARRLAV